MLILFVSAILTVDILLAFVCFFCCSGKGIEMNVLPFRVSFVLSNLWLSWSDIMKKKKGRRNWIHAGIPLNQAHAGAIRLNSAWIFSMHLILSQVWGKKQKRVDESSIYLTLSLYIKGHTRSNERYALKKKGIVLHKSQIQGTNSSTTKNSITCCINTLNINHLTSIPNL